MAANPPNNNAGGQQNNDGGRRHDNARPAPAAPPVIINNNMPNNHGHPADEAAAEILHGAATNATGHEARVVQIADAHFEHLAAGERRRAQAWEDVTLGRVSSWRSVAVIAIIVGLVAVLVLVWLAGKNSAEPTTANAATSPITVMAPAPAYSGPTSIMVASPSANQANLCDSTNCPPAVNICQAQPSPAQTLNCCSQISDGALRDLCLRVYNARTGR